MSYVLRAIADAENGVYTTQNIPTKALL